MTKEKLNEGNLLESEINITESRLRELTKSKRNSMLRVEEKEQEPHFRTFKREVKINTFTNSSWVDADRLDDFFKIEIEIVTKELKELKYKFENL